MALGQIPVLTPHGHLVLAPTAEAVPLPSGLSGRLGAAFERGVGHGLLELGLREVGTALPADFAYWRDFAARYVTGLCTSAHGLPDHAAADAGEVPAPPADALAALANTAPPMPGGEYLNDAVLLSPPSEEDDGIAALHELCMRPGFAPVIFVMPRDVPALRERAMDAGAYGVVVRSRIDHDGLLKMLEAAGRDHRRALADWRISPEAERGRDRATAGRTVGSALLCSQGCRGRDAPRRCCAC